MERKRYSAEFKREAVKLASQPRMVKRQVAIPACECLKRDAGAGARLGRLVMVGVSTRKHAEVIAPMAQSVV